MATTKKTAATKAAAEKETAAKETVKKATTKAAAKTEEAPAKKAPAKKAPAKKAAPKKVAPKKPEAKAEAKVDFFVEFGGAQVSIDEVIKNNDIAVFGTCAGMVLLGKKTDFDQPLIGLMDISVKRNTYGRQKDSFESPIEIFGKEYLGVFIRAPALDDYDHSKEDIKVLSVLDNESSYAIPTSFDFAIKSLISSFVLLSILFVKSAFPSAI